jgi:hypothetical protein
MRQRVRMLKPLTCEKGTHKSHRSSWRQPKFAALASAEAMKAERLSRTPLGSPDVPDVNTIARVVASETLPLSSEVIVPVPN